MIAVYFLFEIFHTYVMRTKYIFIQGKQDKTILRMHEPRMPRFSKRVNTNIKFKTKRTVALYNVERRLAVWFAYLATKAKGKPEKRR